MHQLAGHILYALLINRTTLYHLSPSFLSFFLSLSLLYRYQKEDLWSR